MREPGASVKSPGSRQISQYRCPRPRLRALPGLLRPLPPRKLPRMAKSTTQRLRSICLAFPEAAEKEAWGDATWRVRDKIFTMEKRGDGRSAVWCKAPDGSQAMLIEADPDRFFVPPYVGSKGWVGMRLDTSPDWDEVARLIRRSYRLIAPKRLAAQLD
jgi:predicted DNA-binding protein (MmcQ/YjbR family)